MSILKETGKDRKGIDWLRSKHKIKHKRGGKRIIYKSRTKKILQSMPKKNGWKCIALLENGKTCRNHRINGEFYCSEHIPPQKQENS